MIRNLYQKHGVASLATPLSERWVSQILFNHEVIMKNQDVFKKIEDSIDSLKINDAEKKSSSRRGSQAQKAKNQPDDYRSNWLREEFNN